MSQSFIRNEKSPSFQISRQQPFKLNQLSICEDVVADPEDEEPLERDELPWLKDPNAKISFWTIIKDSIGKGDISKMSVPVYFNDPTSLLQKQACGMEYNDILDIAANESDPLKRIALIAVHQISSMSMVEKIATKPFNPLLGETFEFVTPKFQYLAEQVSHHPPITACYCRGKDYTWYTNSTTNTSFNGKMLKVTNVYRQYYHFDKFNQTYEVQPPILSAHNLIIGTMYIDIGDTMTIINLDKQNEKCEVKFERRSWFSNEAFKLTGEAFTEQGKTKNVVYTIEGNWDRQCTIVNTVTKDKHQAWVKSPYPERVAHMYGMAKFHI